MEKVADPKQRLKELKEYYDIRQVDICNRTGISKYTMSSYCSGRRVPNQEGIYKICNAYGLDLNWFMGYDAPMFAKEYNKKKAIEDANLIIMFNQLQEKDKKLILTMMDTMLNKNL